MHYWRKDYFQSLKDGATIANSLGAWPDYANYCIERERGLRRQAFELLNRFIEELERRPFAERKSFVSWLLEFAEDREGRHLLIPNPLQIRIVEPTLLEWTQVEPHSAEPHRWLGDDEHLEIALALDPQDQIALKKLIVRIMSRIDYATHHLPLGYIGSATEDRARIARVELLLNEIRNQKVKDSLTIWVTEEKSAIEEYLHRK